MCKSPSMSKGPSRLRNAAIFPERAIRSISDAVRASSIASLFFSICSTASEDHAERIPHLVARRIVRLGRVNGEENRVEATLLQPWKIDVAVGQPISNVEAFQQLPAHDMDVGIHDEGVFVERVLGQAASASTRLTTFIRNLLLSRVLSQ